MPQKQTKKLPPEDAYWAATDQELVALRGVIEYVGRTMCGIVGPRNNVPAGRVEPSANNTPTISGGFYSTITNPNIYFSQAVPTYTTTASAAQSIRYIDYSQALVGN